MPARENTVNSAPLGAVYAHVFPLCFVRRTRHSAVVFVASRPLCRILSAVSTAGFVAFAARVVLSCSHAAGRQLHRNLFLAMPSSMAALAASIGLRRPRCRETPPRPFRRACFTMPRRPPSRSTPSHLARNIKTTAMHHLLPALQRPLAKANKKTERVSTKSCATFAPHSQAIDSPCFTIFCALSPPRDASAPRATTPLPVIQPDFLPSIRFPCPHLALPLPPLDVRCVPIRNKRPAPTLPRLYSIFGQVSAALRTRAAHHFRELDTSILRGRGA